MKNQEPSITDYNNPIHSEYFITAIKIRSLQNSQNVVTVIFLNIFKNQRLVGGIPFSKDVIRQTWRGNLPSAKPDTSTVTVAEKRDNILR